MEVLLILLALLRKSVFRSRKEALIDTLTVSNNSEKKGMAEAAA